MNPKEYIRQCYSNATPVREIAAKLGISKKAVKSRAARDPLCPPHGGFLDNGKMSTEAPRKENEMAQKPTKAELSAFEQHCADHNLPFNNWRGFWHKTQEYSSFFVNQQAADEEAARFQKFLDELKKHAPKYPAVKYGRVTDGHMKLIDIADLHVGKYAISKNGIVSYDIETATSMAHEAVTELLRRTDAYPTEKFWLPIGNDVLHVDNKNNTTTRGTRQDVSGMWWESYRAAKKMYVEVIERLLKVAPVEVIYNSSNHDEHLGFCLAELLEAHFRNAKSASFTIEPQNDRIYKTYGRSLIGFDHGDGAKDKDLPLLMATEAAENWNPNQYRYLFRHHLHHWSKTEYLAGKDYPGVTLQYMRSPSASDAWHVKMGYTGVPQAIDAFVFHPNDGQITHTSCVFSR